MTVGPVTRGRILLFVAGTLGLVVAFQLAYQRLVVDSVFLAGYLEWNTAVGAWLLGLLGGESSARGTVLHGRGASVTVGAGCDALQATGILVAAVLAYPALWRHRLLGIVLGAGALAVANVLRILLLLELSVRSRPVFRVMHTEVLPIFFVLLALAAWAAWARRYGPQPATGSVESPPPTSGTTRTKSPA